MFNEPWAIPGYMEAEYYDQGGPGVRNEGLLWDGFALQGRGLQDGWSTGEENGYRRTPTCSFILVNHECFSSSRLQHFVLSLHFTPVRDLLYRWDFM